MVVEVFKTPKHEEEHVLNKPVALFSRNVNIISSHAESSARLTTNLLSPATKEECDTNHIYQSPTHFLKTLHHHLSPPASQPSTLYLLLTRLSLSF